MTLADKRGTFCVFQAFSPVCSEGAKISGWRCIPDLVQLKRHLHNTVRAFRRLPQTFHSNVTNTCCSLWVCGSIYTHACVGFTHETLSKFKITSPINRWKPSQKGIQQRVGVTFSCSDLLEANCAVVFPPTCIRHTPPALGERFLGIPPSDCESSWRRASAGCDSRTAHSAHWKKGPGRWLEPRQEHLKAAINTSVTALYEGFRFTNVPSNIYFVNVFLPFINITAGTRR